MKIKRVNILTPTQLNSLLKENNFWTNGKNFRATCLHTTCAESTREYENLWGIYVTKPDYAWMAVWMAITSRKNLKKRHLRYIRPNTNKGDYIGNLEIYSKKESISNYLCEEAFIYLFNPIKYQGIKKIDCSKISSKKFISYIKNVGFENGFFDKEGKIYNTYKFSSPQKIIMILDEWQIALINFKRITPDIEVHLGKNVIIELSKRIKRIKDKVGDNYIINK